MLRTITLGGLLLTLFACGKDCPPGQALRNDTCGVPSGSVQGAVALADGASPADVIVSLAGTERVASVDSTGAFSFATVTPGLYTLRVRLPGYASGQVDGVSVIDGLPTQVGTVTLTRDPSARPTGSVHGVVARPGESDSSGTLVFLQGTSHAAFTAANGAFSLQGVEDGAYTLVARAEGWRELTQAAITVVSGGAADVGALALTAIPQPRFGAIAGRVTLPGQPQHAGTSVFLAGTSQVASTDAAGDFTFASVAPGTYSLMAVRSGYLLSELPGVTVVADDTTAVAAFALVAQPSSGPDQGGVVGAARRLGATDHSGLTVTLTGGSPVTERITTTTASGGYAFSTVPAGMYRLTFSHPPERAAALENIPVAAGVYLAPEVVLRAPAHLSSAAPSRLFLSQSGNRGLVSFAGDPAVYLFDAPDGALVRIRDTGTPQGISTDGSLAAFSTASNQLWIHRVSDGTSSPHSEAALFVSDLPSHLLMFTAFPEYQTHLLDLDTLQDLTLGFPLPGAARAWSVRPLVIQGQPLTGWTELRIVTDTGTATFGVHSGSGAVAGPGDFLVEPGSSPRWLLSLEEETAFSLRRAKWVDLTDPLHSVILPTAALIHHSPTDHVAGFLAGDDGLGSSVIRLDLLTGVTSELGTLTASLSETAYPQIRLQGTYANQLFEIDFNAGTQTLLCSDSSMGVFGDVRGDNVACLGTTALHVHRPTRVTQVLDTQFQGALEGGSLLYWRSGGSPSLKAFDVDGTGPVVGVCDLYTYETGILASDNGETALVSCPGADPADLRWSIFDLTSGDRTPLFPEPYDATAFSLASVALSSGGRAVAVSLNTTVADGDPAGCSSGDSGACTLFFDLQTARRDKLSTTGWLQLSSSPTDDAHLLVGSTVFQLRMTPSALISRALPLIFYPRFSLDGTALVAEDGSGSQVLFSDLDDPTTPTLHPTTIDGLQPLPGSPGVYFARPWLFDLEAGTVQEITAQLDGERAEVSSGIAYFSTWEMPSDLLHLAADGTVTPLVTAASVCPLPYLLRANDDGSVGELVRYDPQTLAVVPLGIRGTCDLVLSTPDSTRFVLIDQTGTLPELVIYLPFAPAAQSVLRTGIHPAGRQVHDLGTRFVTTTLGPDGLQLVSAEWDGTGARIAGPADETFFTDLRAAPDGNRLFFRARGLAWAESLTGGAPVALGRGSDLSTLVPSEDGRTVAFTLQSTEYPALPFNGLWTVSVDAP